MALLVAKASTAALSKVAKHNGDCINLNKLKLLNLVNPVLALKGRENKAGRHYLPWYEYDPELIW